MLKVQKYTCFVFVLVALFAASSLVSAATVWNGGAGDNVYGTAGNWSNGVPASGNPGTVGVNASFTGNTELGASTTLTFNGGSTSTFDNRFQFYNGTVVNIGDADGGTATVTTNGMTQFHGSLSGNTPATMNVYTGSTYTVKDYFLLGNGNNEYGIMNVNGGTVNSNGTSLTVGDNGTGVINVNSGTLNVTSWAFEIGNHGTSKGTVNQYDGTVAATKNFRVGGGDNTGAADQKNTGTYNFYGGTLTSTNAIQVGYGNGATGTFNVKQGANLADAPAMSIGAQYNASYSRPTGYLVLEAGADADHKTQMSTSKTLNVGDLTNGTMTVNANSVFTSTGTVTIGNAATGIGSIVLKNGGAATFSTLKIGVNGTGELTVEKGSTPTFNTVLLGAGSGTGTLTVADGVSLSIPTLETASDGDQYTSYATNATAKLNVNAGGTLTTSKAYIGADGTGTNIDVAGTWNSKYQLTTTNGTINLTGNGVLNVTLPRENKAVVTDPTKPYDYYASYIGKNGEATLIVTDHAQFNMKFREEGDTGQTSLEWDNTVAFGDGANASGSLEYSSDQQSVWMGNIRFANGAGSTGSIKVTNGSILQCGSFDSSGNPRNANFVLLGVSGKASMEVSGTGSVTMLSTMYVGDQAGSAKTPGNVGGDITVKDSGQLTLNALFLRIKTILTET